MFSHFIYHLSNAAPPLKYHAKKNTKRTKLSVFDKGHHSLAISILSQRDKGKWSFLTAILEIRISVSLKLET
jgi:hypothetical protein